MTELNLVLPPFQGFEDAAQGVLGLLQERLKFGLWMVTRTEGQNWIVLKAKAHRYNVKNGDVFRWSDSFCSRMVRGLGPSIAPRSAEILEYARAPIGAQIPIGAYIGVPLMYPNGDLFGTLCAIDPDPQPDSITSELSLIQSLARLLSTILGMELAAQEIARNLERTRLESTTDYLTGLFNRRGWETLLTVEEERCKRYGSPAAVVIVDLDGLKKVNDTKGHAAGDHLIQQAANRLRGAVRASDITARLGGDELAVLMVESTPANTERLAQRIRRELDTANIPASVGWASRDPREGIHATVKLADERMYAAKLKRKKIRGR